MLNSIKQKSNQTRTQNGAVACLSTLDACLDFFAVSGAIRNAPENKIILLFRRAFASDPDIAIRALFYTRDVRGGIGERRVFRILLHWLAVNFPETVIKNIPNVPKYGRFDDLWVLFDTPAEEALLKFICFTFKADEEAMAEGKGVSLLSKWLPSLGASDPNQKNLAKKLAKKLCGSEKSYRHRLSALRKYIDVLERHLCEKDYTFDYAKQPAKALYKYRGAFLRRDKSRYTEFLQKVNAGKEQMHAGTLYPYEIVHDAIRVSHTKESIMALDATWRALPDYCDDKNAIAVIDGSGSMSGLPIEIATSLGIYFAEHTKGYFHNHFITFSRNPRLIEIHGANIVEKTNYCMSYNEIANTDLFRVFMLILKAAVENKLPQSELPETIYVISDMEFDEGVCNNMFMYAGIKECFARCGYQIPTIVYWNVDQKNEQYPVAKDEIGTILVSGASPSVFKMVISQDVSPVSFMLSVLNADRYRNLCA